MSTKIILFPLIMAFVLFTGCSENATEVKGDPDVKITVDWNSLNNATNKVKEKSADLNTVSDSITHFGVRLVYVNENAVFSQSVEKTTAEEEGIITLAVPATDEAKLFAVAVRKTDNQENAYLLGAINNLSIEDGESYNWTVNDFSWENAEWEVADRLKSDYENGVFTKDKNVYDFDLWYLVKNPFNSDSEVEYEDLIIKVNGQGGSGGYSSGSREYFIQAVNPNQGTVNESNHSFFPYLDGQKFNLPAGRYMIGQQGNFTVRWE